MKRLDLLLSLLTAAFGAADVSPFRYEVPLTATFADQAILRAKLSADVIARSHSDFSDLRVVDDLGGETPFVLYEVKPPETDSGMLVFRPVKYEGAAGREEIVLESEVARKYDELDLSIAGRDFNKTIRVDVGTTVKGPWKPLADGTLFDFSSHVDLRKTKLKIPETEAKFLRATLADVNPARSGKDGTDFELRYKGLDLKAQGGRGEPFRINAVTARLTGRAQAVAQRDTKALPVKSIALDETKDTVLDLGEVSLPLRKIKLTVRTPFYFRRVEAWTSGSGNPKEYSLATSAAIFRVPGMQEAQTSLELEGQQARFLRLRIVNGDNPPLEVSAVEGEWAPSAVYFIGAQGRRYRLFVGSETARPPSYDLARVLPAAKLAELAVTELSLGNILENETYRADEPLGKRRAREKLIFSAVVIGVSLCLGVWIFRLLRKIPA